MGAPTATDAAAALLAAYVGKHGVAPSDAALVLLLSQAMGEGSLSSYFQGTNNFGAMHATSGFASAHASDPGYGMVAFLDRGAGGGAYIARMAVYPTLGAGARAYLDLVERMVNLNAVATSTDYATALYAGGWYEGTATPETPIGQRAAAAASGAWLDGDRANIAAYAAAIDRSSSTATAAVAAAKAGQGADPGAPSSGEFASLADRLTPSSAYAPHTIEHAAAILGAAATSPPAGTISLADALDAPGGDGAWLFGGGSSASSPATSTTIAIVASAVLAAAFVLAIERRLFVLGRLRPRVIP